MASAEPVPVVIGSFEVPALDNFSEFTENEPIPGWTPWDPSGLFGSFDNTSDMNADGPDFDLFLQGFNAPPGPSAGCGLGFELASALAALAALAALRRRRAARRTAWHEEGVAGRGRA